MLTREQEEARYEGLGGSEIASAANLPDAYYSARELYHIKRRELEPRTDDPVLSFLGHGVEAPLARWYAEQTGRKLLNVRTTRRHRDLHWMLAHPDRIVANEKPRRGLEIKMRAHVDGWGPPGTDEVPDSVLLQCQHYMEVLRYQVWDVVVLFRGVELRIYTIPRDKALIDRLIDVGGEFWHRVQVGDPPDLDYEHRATNALIDWMHPQTDGRRIELPPEALSWHEVLEDARAHVARYEKVKDAAKAHLKDLMGDAAIGALPDGSAYRRSERSRTYHNAEGEQRARYMALSFHPAPRRR